jgi:hypothetical protein
MNSHNLRNIAGAEKLSEDYQIEIITKFINDFFPEWNRKKQLSRFAYSPNYKQSFIVSPTFLDSHYFMKEDALFVLIGAGYKEFQVWVSSPAIIAEYLRNPITLDYEPDIYIIPKSWSWVLRYVDEWTGDFRLLILDADDDLAEVLRML